VFLARQISELGRVFSMAEKAFHITIGTVSTKALDIETDLHMLRAALLYADKVKLCSYDTSHIFSIFVQAKSLSHYFDWVERVILPTYDDQERPKQLEKINGYRGLLRKKHLTGNEYLVLSAAKKQFAQYQSDLKTRYPAITQEADLRGVEKAVKRRLLEFHTFESASEESLAAKHFAREPTIFGADVLEEFLNIVSKAIADGNTYPLFDGTTGLLVRNGIEEGRMSASPVRVGQAKHSALAANYLERLPVFDEISVDEILDIRKDLNPYLARFRSGISTYATKLLSASWDKHFPFEADEIFIREVAPAILEIEDKVKSSNYLVTMIVRKTADAKSLVSGSALSFFVERFDLLPKLASIGLGLAVPLAIAIFDAFKARQKEKQEIEKHNLYFYYRAKTSTRV
jgi:hypothetical protein